MMHEVITRRLKAYVEGDAKFSRMPDLIVIDGGKGQLAAALKARDDLKLTIPMTGLAKRMEVLFTPFPCEPIASIADIGSRIADLADSMVRPDLTDADCLPIEDLAKSDLLRQLPLLELLEDEPAINMSSDGPAEEIDHGHTALHGSGEDAIESDGPVGPRAIPMQDQRPIKKKTRAERDAEYDYDRVAPREYLFKDVVLPLNSPGLVLVRRLRDEAHRFALSYHRKLRDKRMHGSALEEVPGVGPRRKRLLLRTFGSVEGIRRATVEEIAAVPTMTKRLAAQIKDYLQEA
jgi:hypothetical protein